LLTLKADQPVAGNSLLRVINAETGQRVQDCYQCGKCTAGCPVASFMDLMPRQVMRAVQLGQDGLVLRSSTIWLCASCETCSARCPMEIDVAGVMDGLRHLARARGVLPAEKGVVLTHDLFLETVRRLGRVYEAAVAVGINIGTLRPFANVMDVGLPLFAKGKLNVMPSRAGGDEVKQIFAGAKRERPEDLSGGKA
jgi:heterodisulfide reductase subunit C2